MSIHKEIMTDFVDDFAVTVSVDKSTVSVYTTVVCDFMHAFPQIF